MVYPKNHFTVIHKITLFIVFCALLSVIPLVLEAEENKCVLPAPPDIKYKIDSSAVPFDCLTAKSFLDTLCRPEFAGRKSGEPEAALAEKWVAEKFLEFGLLPGGTDSFLQPFPILCNRELEAKMELVNGRHGGKKYQPGEDFHLITNSGSGKVKAEVVFAGYGMSEPEKGWDEYEGIDVKGKIVLICRGTPPPERDWREMRWRDYKLNTAVGKGAKAVIFSWRDNSISGAAVHLEAFHPGIPVLMISENVADDIFRGAGRRYRKTIDKLDTGPLSFNTGKILSIKTKLRRNPEAKAANVIGIIPGSDPLLKEEWIIIGGHLDHNGVNAVSDTFFGADDNASGASIVMELARGFASLESPLKRSLMFIAFAAEEQGLLGSKYFTENPTIPLENVTAMFNYDCCGLGEGKPRMGGAEHFPAVWEEYIKTLSDNDLETMEVSRHWKNGSDNHYFQEWGTPTFNLSSVGDRLFYHLQEDIPRYITPGTLESVGKASGNFIHYLAQWDEPLLRDNYRQRTCLYSAYTVNLKPASIPQDSGGTAALAQALKQRWRRGLKCQFVAAPLPSAEEAWEYWRRFSLDHDFVWASSAGDVRRAYNKKNLALTPILTDLEGIDPEGMELEKLKLLGIKTLSLNDEPLDSILVGKILVKAAGLGMLLVHRGSAPWKNEAPKDLRRVELVEADEAAGISPEDIGAERLRWCIIDGFPDLNLQTSAVLENKLHLSLALSSDSELVEALTYLAKLEKSGWEQYQILYILGGNLLEVFPE